MMPDKTNRRGVKGSSVSNCILSPLTGVASFADVLADPAFTPGEWVAAERSQDGAILPPYTTLSLEAAEFMKAAYRARLVGFDWIEWSAAEEGRSLILDGRAISRATPEQLAKLLTAILRRDRFVEGTLLEAFKAGTMAAIAHRARELVGAE